MIKGKRKIATDKYTIVWHPSPIDGTINKTIWENPPSTYPEPYDESHVSNIMYGEKNDIDSVLKQVPSFFIITQKNTIDGAKFRP